MPNSASPRIAAVIFDWAGTVIDFGCMAPVLAFRGAFAEAGIEVTEAETRIPMGSAKREHIRQMLAMPEVESRWRDKFGAAPDEAALDDLYARFLRLDNGSVDQNSALIPGALETIEGLRARGAAIGSTTGYPRQIMERIIPLAAAQGYRPDNCITPDEAARARPWPDMLQASAADLKVSDPAACVVVDDSPGGLEAARNASMWAVGVAGSGNEVGLTLEDWNDLSAFDRARALATAETRLHDAGAHFVVETIAGLPAAIDAIEARLRAGERPQ